METSRSSSTQSAQRPKTKYGLVAEKLIKLIGDGTYEPGEKLPSIRTLHRELGMSINTIKEAFRLLEDQGIIEPISTSGYFIVQSPRAPIDQQMDFSRVYSSMESQDVRIPEIVRQVVTDSSEDGVTDLFIITPDQQVMPAKELQQSAQRIMQQSRAKALTYSLPDGSYELRQEISRRMFLAGLACGPEQVLITNGCMEAIFLSLQTLCQPGDTVLVESPTFHIYYQLLQRLHLRVLEIPSLPDTGIDLDALEFVLRAHQGSKSVPAPKITSQGNQSLVKSSNLPYEFTYSLDSTQGITPIRVGLLMSNGTNPMGIVLSEEKKQKIAQLFSTYGIPLIEDDIYGELHFSPTRPQTITSYMNPELAITCSSFSKSLAPGLRIGWLCAHPGLLRQIRQTKWVTSIATSSVGSLILADFLNRGLFDKTVKQARAHYEFVTKRIQAAVNQYFPSGTQMTNPQGGMMLWVVLPPGFDSLKLYEETRKQGVIFGPGTIHSVNGAYRNCLRISTVSWNDQVHRAIEIMGRLAKDQI